jgi:uncharacterized UBP type Zn finger protein
MMDLMTKPMSTLVTMHNHLSDKPASMKTFSQRSKAVERIMALAAGKGITVSDHFDEDGSIKPPPKATTVTATVEAKPAKKKADEKAPKAPSIRSLAEKLLLEVVRIDEDKRKVGIPYEDIITTIKQAHPNAKTTVACLRWYAVHMREADVMPPNRPRAVPKKVEAPQEEAVNG